MDEPDPDKVKTKDDFIQFLKDLDENFEKDQKKYKGEPYGGNSEWEHWYAGDYLEAIAACLENKEEQYKTKTLSWKDLANIILMGKYYE